MKAPRAIVFILLAMVVLFDGCATFRPEPLSPLQTVTSFKARALDDLGLKKFLEANLRHEIVPWPPKAWNFPLLTLVAFYYHPDLDLARAKWGVAEAGVITAGQHPNPRFGFTPRYNADAAGGASPWAFTPAFDVPIETAGKRGYRIAQAQHLSEAARLNIAQVAWQVRSRLRARLLNLYAAKERAGLLEQQQKEQGEIVRLLEQRLAVGEASQPDVTQERISLHQTSLALREAQRQSAEAHARLADALGLPVEALDGVALSFETFNGAPPMTDLPPENVRRQALLNRADILGALAEYAASQSALQLEIAKQYPDIHLGPGYKWDQGDNKWSFGISLTLPILNQNQGPIAEAEARRKEAAARFAALQARVIGEIDRSLAGYRAALKKLGAADILLAEQRKQLESVRELFKAGGADRLALVGAQLELRSLELSRLDALITVQQSLALVEDSVERPLKAEGFPAKLETDFRAKKEGPK